MDIGIRWIFAHFLTDPPTNSHPTCTSMLPLKRHPLPSDSPNKRRQPCIEITNLTDPASTTNQLDFTLQTLEEITISEDWLQAFRHLFLKTWFINLKSKLQRELNAGSTIYPPLCDIYSFTKLSLEKIRIVIVLLKVIIYRLARILTINLTRLMVYVSASGKGLLHLRL
jgi:hypothetical protein